ncbi:hypothetical protein O3M35_005828 [Rhynocoris fuscipes]|uniref:Pigment-dispersing factor n=1 Tax=Rhynocoris fuscipes TaxID=488301 RepID=A0AAW1DKC1_9HEMI
MIKEICTAIVLVLLAGLTFQQAIAENSLADDRYTIAEQMNNGVVSVRELASWLLYLAQRHDQPHKRNSEIINSLLGLPKVLNDAGR